MPNDDILAERDFTISHRDVNYAIKAKAVFVTHGFRPEEVGIYHLTFLWSGGANPFMSGVQTKILLRQPVFLGLRSDKDAKDVVRE